MLFRDMHAVNRPSPSDTPAVGGWLLVLSRLMILWHPILVALMSSPLLDSLSVRGRSVTVILLARVFVTGLGVAAGLALRGRQARAVGLAKISLAMSATTDMFIYFTPSFPSNRAPGETPLWVLGTLMYYGGWILYLMRSARVRETFGRQHLIP
jgi:hypothetical protein